MKRRLSTAVLAAAMFVTTFATPVSASDTSNTETITGDCPTGYTFRQRVRGEDLSYSKSWGDNVNGPATTGYRMDNTGLQYHWGQLKTSSTVAMRTYDGGAEGYAYATDWGDRNYTLSYCSWFGY
jgi:hypothetical protein